MEESDIKEAIEKEMKEWDISNKTAIIGLSIIVSIICITLLIGQYISRCACPLPVV